MITFIALGGIFIDAYDFSSISFGMPDITKVFRLTPLVEGVVAASIMIGAILGALLGGYLVDRVGRYKIFMADMFFFVVAALACAVAPNAGVLVAARLLMGFGIGMDFPVALAFIAEFNALRGRGGRLSLWQVMWYATTSSSFLVLVPLYFLIPATSGADVLWRWAVGFGALPALVVMLVRRKYMNESASWAANQGDLPRAAAILRESYGIDAVVRPMIPFNLRGLIAARGGTHAWEAFLDSMTANLTNPGSTGTDVSNEEDLLDPWEYDYTGEPWKTQQVVRQVQTQLYSNTPAGEPGNDDLGTFSAW